MTVATDRLLKPFKVITLTFTGITSDQMLVDASNNNYFDVSDVEWERITVEYNVTSFTGTNVVFKVVTGSKDAALSTTSVAAVKGDGSTSFASGTLTATGVGAFATARKSSDGSAATNIGKFIGVWADVTSVSALAGQIYIYIGK